MKKFFVIPFILIYTLIFAPCIAQDTKDYQTFTYFQDDSTELLLDLFISNSADTIAPLVIFMHGGGFSGGNRSYGREFCRFLSENGIHAATISYTLYMKNKNFSCDGILTEKIKAIQMAAYQGRIATQWFIEHADSLRIDTTLIFLAGSSAGAEAVLQAAFWDTTAVNFFPDTLSPSFVYAGLISGAGALIDINMINECNSIPTILFHGTCDPLVPYYIGPHHYCSQIASGYMMMFGSLAIHEKQESLNQSSQLMSYCNEGHEHAATGFGTPGKFEVLDFIQKIISGEHFYIHRIFKNSKECKMGLDFVFCYEP